MRSNDGVVALRGRLLPGASTEYKRAHDRIPRDVIDAQRASGLRRWLIFQDGLDLIHVAESQDFDESIRVLPDTPRIRLAATNGGAQAAARCVRKHRMSAAAHLRTRPLVAIGSS